jgi:hypothetical protein
VFLSVSISISVEIPKLALRTNSFSIAMQSYPR